MFRILVLTVGLAGASLVTHAGEVSVTLDPSTVDCGGR